MQCKLCLATNGTHKDGCPHEFPEGSFEREEYLHGMRDGKSFGPLSAPTDYYILGWQNGAGLR